MDRGQRQSASNIGHGFSMITDSILPVLPSARKE
jgi:hypothetical protein